MSKGYLIFKTTPSIVATAIVVGPLEKCSTFANDFDEIESDELFNQETNEKAQATMIEKTINLTAQKGNIALDDVDIILGGDLVNQLTPTNFALRQFQTPFIGMFSACATSMSTLITAALLVDSNMMKYAMSCASSHHNATERQFRYPIDYGAQKPPTSQWTVTACGGALVGKYKAKYPKIVSATVGKIIDEGLTDPLDMGSAMAPAALDTIVTHLNSTTATYDLVITGDLGKTGLQALKTLLQEHPEIMNRINLLRDGGDEFYGDEEKFLSGASGAGCSASVFFGSIYKQLKDKKLTRVLFVATGALLSPLSFQQGESIPCIAHAVEIVMEKGGVS